ncbi:c-type cytochrome [Sphingomonas parva]|uniref:c-type cytochrome n=1 Tax=Sphingomonas parva TaxID=2555898 RepID=UPI001430C3AF|nr:cytochrome c [Sphingomonas parva]
MKPLFLPALALALLAACQRTPASETFVVAPPPSSAERGETLARSVCAGCHAIDRTGTSPNPNAPPFAAVVNREGVTAETLSAFLADAHNYPREMDFSVHESAVDDLVAWMLTLKDPGYRPQG